MGFDKKGGFERDFVEGLKKPDGSFHPVMNVGPWGDGRPYVIVSDADAYREILKNQKKFPKMPNTYRWFSYLIGEGLVSAKGEPHKEQRRRITPLFHFKILRQIVPAMVNLTKVLVEGLKNNQDYHLAKSLFSLHTMRVIVKLAFGGDFEAEWMSEIWFKITRAFSYWTVGWVTIGPLWNHVPLSIAKGFQVEKSRLKNEIIKVLNKRKQMYDKYGDPPEEERNDLLYYLLRAKDKSGNPITIPDDDIVNEAMTFLFAGHDTSSSALSWAFYYLATHPDVFAKVREEVDTILGDREMTVEDVPEFKYTKSVVNETLRIKPVIPMVDRIATEDFEIDGYNVPAGTYLGICLWSAPHDIRYFDKPYEFNPDRPKKKHEYSNIPFSVGERNCIGSKFAIQEIIIAVVMIVRELDVKYDETKEVIATYEGVIEPSNLFLKFTPRVDKSSAKIKEVEETIENQVEETIDEETVVDPVKKSSADESNECLVEDIKGVPVEEPSEELIESFERPSEMKVQEPLLKTENF